MQRQRTAACTELSGSHGCAPANECANCPTVCAAADPGMLWGLDWGWAERNRYALTVWDEPRQRYQHHILELTDGATTADPVVVLLNGKPMSAVCGSLEAAVEHLCQGLEPKVARPTPPVPPRAGSHSYAEVTPRSPVLPASDAADYAAMLVSTQLNVYGQVAAATGSADAVKMKMKMKMNAAAGFDSGATTA